MVSSGEERSSRSDWVFRGAGEVISAKSCDMQNPAGAAMSRGPSGAQDPYECSGIEEKLWGILREMHFPYVALFWP
jgi:hypothetical protein